MLCFGGKMTGVGRLVEGVFLYAAGHQTIAVVFVSRAESIIYTA